MSGIISCHTWPHRLIASLQYLFLSFLSSWDFDHVKHKQFFFLLASFTRRREREWGWEKGKKKWKGRGWNDDSEESNLVKKISLLLALLCFVCVKIQFQLLLPHGCMKFQGHYLNMLCLLLIKCLINLCVRVCVLI